MRSAMAGGRYRLTRSWLLVSLSLASGCGYHTLGHSDALPPNIHTIAIPGFVSQSRTFRIEQLLTDAVVREFNTRTQFHVVARRRPDADAVLKGTVLSAYYHSPRLRFRQTGRAASALVTMSVQVTLTDQQGQGRFPESVLSFSRSVRNLARSQQFLRRGIARGRSPVPRFRAHSGRQYSGGLLMRGTMRAFSQADRFLSELQSRKLKPAYVLVGDEAFFRKRCRDAILEHLVAPDARDFSVFEFDLGETVAQRSSGSCPHAIAHGAVSGLLCARRENALRARLERRKDRRHRGVLQKSQSGCAPRFRRRSHQHSRGRSPHGNDRQRSLPENPRRPRPVLRHCRAFARRRRRGRSLDRRILRDARRQDRPRWRSRTGRRARRRHDDGFERTRKTYSLRRREERESRSAMSKPWCSPPSSARFTS